jgi:hypothetical protein
MCRCEEFSCDCFTASASASASALCLFWIKFATFIATFFNEVDMLGIDRNGLLMFGAVVGCPFAFAFALGFLVTHLAELCVIKESPPAIYFLDSSALVVFGSAEPIWRHQGI